MYTNNISGLHLWTMSHTTRSATAFHNINPACTANFILLLSSPPLIVLLKLRLNHNWYPACILSCCCHHHHSLYCLSYGSITTGILPALLIYPPAVIATITPPSYVITVFNPVLLCLAYMHLHVSARRVHSL